MLKPIRGWRFRWARGGQTSGGRLPTKPQLAVIMCLALSGVAACREGRTLSTDLDAGSDGAVQTADDASGSGGRPVTGTDAATGSGGRLDGGGNAGGGGLAGSGGNPGPSEGGRTGAGGVIGSGGAAGMNGAGGSPITCSSQQHPCGTTCVANTSTDQCGPSCVKCAAPVGAIATCDGSACGFDCGALKKCTATMICVPANGCCGNGDCPPQVGGQTGTCDTATHTCNYNCPANTLACTIGTTTSCIATTACCTSADCTSGDCMQCNASHACVPAANQADPTGRCAGTCDATGTCKSKQGQTCSTVPAGCVSGTTCVDGYCCDGACTGACQACNVAGLEGKCSSVPSGPPHASRTCGGCAGQNFVGPGTCSSGVCASTPAPVVCPGGFLCGTNVCKSSCASDTDCAQSYFCASGTCHPDAVKIVSGATHTCALLFDGSVRCWGGNGQGQIGNGTTSEASTPVTPTGLGHAVDIAAGTYHTCAVIDDGTVWCWGLNSTAQLGNAVATMVDPNEIGSTTPVKVTGFPPASTKAVTVAGGQGHSCATISDGSVYCWGSDGTDEIGTRVATSFNGISGVTVTPLRVGGLPGQAMSVAASSGSSFALIAGGTVSDWGFGFAGELGNGSTIGSVTPVTVSSLTSVTVLSAAPEGASGCAIAGGVAKCWGDNTYGQIGNGMFGAQAPALSPATVTKPASATAPARAIAMGSSHACAIYSNAGVWCWGRNLVHELGATTTTTVGTDPGSPTPVQVSNLSAQATGITAGRFFSCALLVNGSVMCWGENVFAELGNGTFVDSAVPVQVTGW